MRTLASLTTLLALSLAIPPASADMHEGKSARYVAFSHGLNACNWPVADGALAGGVCFSVDVPSGGGKRLHLVIEDDFAAKAFAYYELIGQNGQLKGVGHLCGEHLTPILPASVVEISVSIYPGAYLHACPDSAGSGVSGTVHARFV